MAVLDPFIRFQIRNVRNEGLRPIIRTPFSFLQKPQMLILTLETFSAFKKISIQVFKAKKPPPSLEIQFYFAKYQFLYPARIRFLLKT